MAISTQQIPASASDRGSPGFIYLVSAVAALGGLLFGYDTAVIAGAIGFMKAQFTLGAAQEGFVASCVLIGCAVGAGFAGVLADRFGRKKVLILSAFFFGFSAWGAAMPQHVILPAALLSALVKILEAPMALLLQTRITLPVTMEQFAVARFVGGLGIGIASMLSPLYIAEAAPARIRGSLVSLNQFAIISGILIAYLVDWACAKYFGPAVSWRWMFGFGVAPALFFFLALLIVPESPRWLVKQGRTGQALGILTRVGGRAHAESEMRDIVETVAHEGGSVLQLFNPGLRLALLIGVALAIFQQITGINAILYYAPEIFKSAGFDTSNALLFSIYVGLANALFTVFAILLVDRLGRKPLLLLGATGMGISLALVARAFHQKMTGGMVAVFVVAYVASFALTLGPVVWVVISEIFPTRIRGRAMSIATVILWISCYAVSQTFPMLVARIKEPATFLIYSVICFVMIVFVAVVVPETKGKTLEEIERKFTR